MAFYVGQKVVCVGGKGKGSYSQDDWDAWVAYYQIALPQRGTIYTVRQIWDAPDGLQRIRLMEIVNPPADYSDALKQEPWFLSRQFRPLDERETDISVFTSLLTPTQQMEDA